MVLLAIFSQQVKPIPTHNLKQSFSTSTKTTQQAPEQVQDDMSQVAGKPKMTSNTQDTTCAISCKSAKSLTDLMSQENVTEEELQSQHIAGTSLGTQSRNFPLIDLGCQLHCHWPDYDC